MRSQITPPLLKTPHAFTLLHGRPETPQRASNRSEETLIVDDRAALRPADMVEDKLVRILKNASLPVSQARLKSLILSRSAS